MDLPIPLKALKSFYKKQQTSTNSSQTNTLKKKEYLFHLYLKDTLHPNTNSLATSSN